MSADVMESYGAACARYTDAVVAATRARDEAVTRYRGEVNEIRRTAQQAVEVRDFAETEAAATARLVTETDEACVDIWRRLGGYVGQQNLGDVPEADLDAVVAKPEQVKESLDRTRRSIALVQRGELPFDPPGRVLPIAAAIGAGAGVAAALFAGLLLAYGQGGERATAVAQAAALVVVFVGVFVPIPVVTGWLAVRHRIAVRPQHAAVAVAGAIAVMCLAAPWMPLR